MRYTKIFNIINKDYNHENSNIPRSEAFSKEFKRIILNKVKGKYTVVNHLSGYCECSGFLTDGNGHYVYYSSGDFRFNPRWYSNILVRVAADTTDYVGGINHYTDLDNFVNIVNGLFGSLKRQGHIRKRCLQVCTHTYFNKEELVNFTIVGYGKRLVNFTNMCVNCQNIHTQKQGKTFENVLTQYLFRCIMYLYKR